MQIRPFSITDQTAAKSLILAGLKEHWGELDPTLNPDLNNIAASYHPGYFLVGIENEKLIATGALLAENAQTAQIVRMSVDNTCRRKGYGRAMLWALIELAREKQFTHLTLETTSTWTDVIQFYLANGFQITHERDGDTYFSYPLLPTNT